MVDYCARIKGEWVGVSVTRATGYPTALDFDEEEAARLLRKKLNGLIVARHGVSTCHGFQFSILHVLCESKTAVRYVVKAAPRIVEELDIKDTVAVCVTLCGSREVRGGGAHSYIYRERPGDVEKFAQGQQ